MAHVCFIVSSIRPRQKKRGRKSISEDLVGNKKYKARQLGWLASTWIVASIKWAWTYERKTRLERKKRPFLLPFLGHISAKLESKRESEKRAKQEEGERKKREKRRRKRKACLQLYLQGAWFSGFAWVSKVNSCNP